MSTGKHPLLGDFLDAAHDDHRQAEAILERAPDLLEARNGTGETALHYLAIENSVDAVLFLLGKGANINTRDASGATPLMHASQLGYVNLVEVLLARGADVHLRSEDDETVLHAAADTKAPDVIDLLRLKLTHHQIQPQTKMPCRHI